MVGRPDRAGYALITPIGALRVTREHRYGPAVPRYTIAAMTSVLGYARQSLVRLPRKPDYVLPKDPPHGRTFNGMYLMEQALFSAELMKDHGPQSIRTVALCRSGDLRLQPLCERYGIEVVTTQWSQPRTRCADRLRT